MPRGARGAAGGICYHVVNRGNRRETVFHDDGDYLAFVSLMERAGKHIPMRVLAYALMPNHFHLALWPRGDNDLGQWLQRVLTGHVRRHGRRYDLIGRIWQGRSKSFPVQNDEHLARVLRYIERNPLGCGLVTEAAAWPWSSHRLWRSSERPGFLLATDIVLNRDWPEIVAEPQTDGELDAIRRCVRKGSPYGDDAWTSRTATRLHLEHTLRIPGRPPKARWKAKWGHS